MEDKIEKIIKIDDEWRIVTIPMNYCLERFTNIKKNDGSYNLEWDRIGYYPDIESICFDFLQIVPFHSKARSVQGVIDAIKDAEEKITKLISKL